MKNKQKNKRKSDYLLGVASSFGKISSMYKTYSRGKCMTEIMFDYNSIREGDNVIMRVPFEIPNSWVGQKCLVGEQVNGRFIFWHKRYYACNEERNIVIDKYTREFRKILSPPRLKREESGK